MRQCIASSCADEVLTHKRVVRSRASHAAASWISRRRSAERKLRSALDVYSVVYRPLTYWKQTTPATLFGEVPGLRCPHDKTVRLSTRLWSTAQCHQRNEASRDPKIVNWPSRRRHLDSRFRPSPLPRHSCCRAHCWYAAQSSSFPTTLGRGCSYLSCSKPRDHLRRVEKPGTKTGDSTLNSQTGQTGGRFPRSRVAYPIKGAYLLKRVTLRF